MLSRKSVLIVIVLITGLFLVACQPAAPATVEPAADTSPITIGVSLPLSGTRGEAGLAARQGYETWVAMVNEAGGLLGRQIELTVLDNASDPEIVVTDYEKLINEDNVDLVVGTQSSGLVIPSSEVAAKYGYAYVEPAGGAPGVFDRGLTNIFFAQPAVSARQADPFALYLLGLSADIRPKTFALVYNAEDPFVVGVMDRLKGLLVDGGLEMVYESTYAEGETEFGDVANELVSLNPDLYIGGTQLDDCVAQINAYQAVGYQPRFAYFTSGPSNPGPFRQALGSATQGIFTSVGWSPEANGHQNSEFTAKYIEMFGGDLGDVAEDAANAFTVGQVLQQAVESIESIDNAALIAELHRGTYDTVVGALSFDETGAPLGNYMLVQWQGTTFVVVGPSDRAETDPLSPPKPAW